MENNFDKNSFDWIVYILAWFVSPFLILFFFVCLFREVNKKSYDDENTLSLLSGTNWEERRRKNLYLVIELILFAATLTLPILLLNKSALKDSEIAAAIIIPLGFLAGALFMYSFWEASHLYEEHIETKSYKVL